jgi:DNA-binding transcriptional LysR family regulator
MIRTNPKEMEIRLLRLFEAVYSTGSVTRAAVALELSQPTVSIGLASLRKHFGDDLFVRTATGFAPTPLADQLIWPVREVLQGADRLSNWTSVFDPATEDRTFRIAMTDASHIALMPQLYAHVRMNAPAVRLEATSIDSTLARRLQSGDADIAIGLVHGLETGFYQQALYMQDWICLTRRHHPLMADGMTLGAYERGEHVAIIGGTGQALLEEAIERQGVDRDVRLKLPGFLGISATLTGSDLISTLPRNIGETLARNANLEVHACPFAIEEFAVRQHWHARYHDDPANRWLRSLCSNLFARHI